MYKEHLFQYKPQFNNVFNVNIGNQGSQSFFYSYWDEIESTWYCGNYWPKMIDDSDCGAIGGMKIGRGIRST
jgi:hypothetical protein